MGNFGSCPSQSSNIKSFSRWQEITSILPPLLLLPTSSTSNTNHLLSILFSIIRSSIQSIWVAQPQRRSPSWACKFEYSLFNPSLLVIWVLFHLVLTSVETWWFRNAISTTSWMLIKGWLISIGLSKHIQDGYSAISITSQLLLLINGIPIKEFPSWPPSSLKSLFTMILTVFQ